jgi:hypothetical protein
VVDLDAALGEQLFDVAIGQAEAQVPAHRQDDDGGRESGSWHRPTAGLEQARAASSHAGSLAA